jgi:predicted aspartyl protease
MGTFRTQATVSNILNRAKSATLSGFLVDTGSEYTWVPGDVLAQLNIKREKKDVQLVMANGKVLTRNIGFAIMTVGGEFTVDEVVFAEPGDQLILGARTMEGLNLKVDPRAKKLVFAGPALAAGQQRPKPRKK